MSKTQEALALVNQGMTPFAAAKQVGLSANTLYVALKKERVKQGVESCPCCGSLVPAEKINRSVVKGDAMSKSDDIKPEPVPELVGKTITEAHIVTDSAGNKDVVIRCSDGTVFIVTAWQEEGYPLYMGVSEKINRDVLKG